jgi:GntR family transcriptional regulator / MocR family aminotransferase
MPKQATSLPLSLSAPLAGTPLYRWFYDELRSAILEGRILPGARLPATRDLAREYKLSRATVVIAFEQLQSEGYVESRVGAGTYVSQVLPDDLLQVGRTSPRKSAGPRRVHWSAYARRLQLYPGGGARLTRAFRANQAALDVFPTTLWAQVVARRLRRASAQLLSGGEALGYRPLRQAVAAYLNASRGVKCSADQVLIISGVQEALERAAHLLIDPGDPVWMEDPGYPGASIVFRAVGAKLRPVPVDDEGLDLERGQQRWGNAKLIYVTPAHQFPLGVTMSLRRRLALLEWARRSHTLIFEDDYDSEYRYQGRPIPALQGLDRAGVVIYAGTFNEVLFPALRLAYLVVPPGMVDRFAAAQAVSMRHAPLLNQAALCDFITGTFRAAYSPDARTLLRKTGCIPRSFALSARRAAPNPGCRSWIANCGMAGSGDPRRKGGKRGGKTTRRSDCLGPLFRAASFRTARLASGLRRCGRARIAARSGPTGACAGKLQIRKAGKLRTRASGSCGHGRPRPHGGAKLR